MSHGRKLLSRVALVIAVVLAGTVSGAFGAPPQPRVGGSWTSVFAGDPVMNSTIALGIPSFWSSAILFDALTKPDERGRPVPNLAERWDISSDGKTYTFYLRKDVKWHDGRPFTADDVKFTMDTIKDPKTNTSLRGNFGPVERVDVVNASTVRFTLSRPYVTLLSWLYTYSGIVPKHILEGKDVNTYTDFSKKTPIGTGPFKIREYRPAEYVMLERYDAYHGAKSYLDRVIWKIIPDTNAAVAQLRAGGLDFISNIPPTAVRPLQQDRNLEVMFVDAARYDFVALNLNMPMFQDKKLRQALAHALNRQALLNVGTEGFGVLAHGPIGPAHGDWYNRRLRPLPYDTARGAALLAEAGWTDTDGDGIVEKNLGDGRRTPLRFKLLHFAARQDHESMAAIIKENWRQIGVDVVLDPTEFAQVQQNIIRRGYEGLLNSWNTLHDPDLYTYFHSSTAMAGPNYAVWRNADADRLLEAGQSEGNVARRREIYNKFQELVRDEQPMIFTFHPKELNARSRKVQGLMRAPYGRINSYWMHKVWMAP